MTTRQKLWVAVAAAHVLLVIYSAVRLPAPSVQNPAGLALRCYGSMSGASNSYGFFKVVGNNCRVKFTMTDTEGQSWTDVLSRTESREAEMRYAGSTYLFPDFGDHVAAHWAATMFGRHPRARQVIVQVEQFEPPSMEEFREGKRPEWVTCYLKAFLRKGQDQ